MEQDNYAVINQKLLELCGCNAIAKNQKLPSDGIENKMTKLREEICMMLKEDHFEFLEMLVASGIIDVANIDGESFIVQDTKSIYILDSNLITLVTGDIHISAGSMPRNIIDWYSDSYNIEPMANIEQ